MQADRINPGSDTIVSRLMTNGRSVLQGGGELKRAQAAERAAQVSNGVQNAASALPGTDFAQIGRTTLVSGAGRKADNVQVELDGAKTERARRKPAPKPSEPARVAAEDLPVSYALNDKTATAPNITITSGVPAGGAIVGALSEINQAAGGQTLVDTNLGTTSLTKAANDGTNIISFAQGNYRFNRGTIAVSISYITASRIAGADVLFNPNMAFSTDDSGAVEQSSFDIQGLATHELTHTLGVGHLNDPQATMYPVVSETDDVKLRSLEQVDKDALGALYPSGA